MARGGAEWGGAEWGWAGRGVESLASFVIGTRDYGDATAEELKHSSRVKLLWAKVLLVWQWRPRGRDRGGVSGDGSEAGGRGTLVGLMGGARGWGTQAMRARQRLTHQCSLRIRLVAPA